MREDPSSALLCSVSDKEHLETRNSAKQLEYIEWLLNRGDRKLRESHIIDLQKYAVEDLYPCAGKYRVATSDVRISGSDHELPEAALVPGLVKDAITWINNSNRQLIERAAYALWRFNWIHPFCGGNGRTSRAIAYLVLCLGEGRMLPGTKTIPTIISKLRKNEYILSLKAADRSEKVKPEAEDPDFSLTTRLLDNALTQQLELAIAEFSAAPLV
jgi:fido (protein-threonine AMPylation protein)